MNVARQLQLREVGVREWDCDRLACIITSAFGAWLLANMPNRFTLRFRSAGTLFGIRRAAPRGRDTPTRLQPTMGAIA